MHKRHSGGLAAAAALFAATVVTGGAGAHAENDDGGVAVPAAPATSTVVLPTGDAVTVFPDGGTGLLPAEGREGVGFLTIPAPDGSGDTLVIPHDRAEAIKTGAEDPRRYNVTDLAAAGIADAGAADAARLEDVGDAGLTNPVIETSAAEAQKFSVQLRDRSGAVPQNDFVIVADNETGEWMFLEFDAAGVGSEALEPGDYTLIHGFWNNVPDTYERTEIVLGITPVTMGSSQSLLVLDATDAQPVTVDVERPDAVQQVASVAVSTSILDRRFGFTDYAGPEAAIYLMPEPDQVDVKFSYETVLTSPEGADDPYTYNLAFLENGSFPDDTSFAVTDDELAAVETSYHDLGVPVPGFTCTYGDIIAEPVGTQNCPMVPVEFPSVRTEYYNAGPSMEWVTSAMGGRVDEDGWGVVEGFRTTETIRPEVGERSSRDMVNGPFGGGTADGVLLSSDEGGEISLQVNLAGAYNGEAMQLLGFQGTAVLTKDGLETPVWEGGLEDGELGAPLAGAGRYTLTAEGARDTATGLFATAATAEWTFDADPAAVGDEDYAEFSLPTVAFEGEGVQGGWADAWCPQEVVLSLEPGLFGDAGATLADAELEVSYDDGKTWTEVSLELNGSVAEGTLRHPPRADYVSVRVNATDDRGNEISYTTIRSYGLRSAH